MAIEDEELASRLEALATGELVSEEPPVIEPEYTMADLKKEMDIVRSTLGVLFLAIGQYPLPRELPIALVKACGVQFDEMQAFRQGSRIVLPSAVPGKTH